MLALCIYRARTVMNPPLPSRHEVAAAMAAFLREIPESANLLWASDRDFLHHFEAERLLTMCTALFEAGFTTSTCAEVLDFGYLHGLVPEFIHRVFPNTRFTACDHPDSPIFRDPEYLEVIKRRDYMTLQPLDIIDADQLAPAKFRVIILGEIIEHLDPTTVAKVLAHIRKLVADDGVLLITTPNGAGLYNSLQMLFGSYPPPVCPPIPDETMVYGHIHLWALPALQKTLQYCGWREHRSYFNHGREAEAFENARRVWGSLKYQLFIRGTQLLANIRPSWRGFFVTTAFPV